MISGQGTNMRAIVHRIRQQNLNAEVVAVVSSDPDAPGVAWALEQGLTTHVVAPAAFSTRRQWDTALADVVARERPDYILLAGFMRVLAPGFVEQYAGRMLNIHPSLLPAFPGLRTHEQALAAGVQWHGCTVHFVTPDLDSGPIVAQVAVFVHPDDTPRRLADRVRLAEHRLYPDVVTWLVQGRVSLNKGGRVDVAGVAPRAYVALSSSESPAQLKILRAGNESSTQV
ncbi:phosphoribosylglycinamide formyltransferase [Neopusillimonas maritima]|uniref:Phosphoribosylglycinamide formyltransferase n=1 Tax=Neopusillimonas maritima TaxID=2026239 RepID=A0ABX9N0K0_9BURK|nr:phosphoribosylglycinamide formyltransferase [Neopusillimonas maritima]RII84573.1 phosphoribosylglycinamide formyltransferase [Neopusillimonas maritima]